MTTKDEALALALEALEALATAKLADGTYADKDCKITFAITAIKQAQAPYVDSTPELSVGESSFESWYSTYERQGVSKQVARDAYAAGMGDPLVQAQQAQGPIKKPSTYLVVWETKNSEGVMTDHWVATSDEEEAHTQYKALISRNDIYTASLCWPIRSTDYE